jgi:hypothetical protein
VPLGHTPSTQVSVRMTFLLAGVGVAVVVAVFALLLVLERR